MVTKVVMPRLSLTMKEGTVGIWYKKEGDSIKKGEPLVEVFSEKATYDLEAPTSGVVRRTLVQEGTDVPVNTVLAIITAPDEPFDEADIPAEMLKKPEKRILASPAAKRLAREHQTELSLVEGTGPEGRIVEEDVKNFIQEANRILPKVREVIPLRGYRKTSAERVANSFRTAPHSTVVMEVDFSKAKILHGERQVSFTSILVKACGKGLTEYPIINSTLQDNQIRILEEVNIGIAVATENGLVVPVIHNAEEKKLEEIDENVRELTEKAREGKLAKEDLTGGTFTITNLGMYGVEFFTPIINPPEAAILAVGRIAEKPVVVKGKIEIRPIVRLSLSYDHRIVDGAPAAEFLRKIKEKIQEPSEL